MASLYVHYLPLDETIDICVDNLYNGNKNPPNISKHDFHNLLNIATKELFFIFNNKYHKQLDGVVMGSPVGPALVNMFMCSFESKWKHPNTNFSIEKEKDGCLLFLDVNLFIENKKLASNIYRMPSVGFVIIISMLQFLL